MNIRMEKNMPNEITIRGAKVHNLKNIDVSIPLGKLVAIAGVSGSGKSSLALGVLYAEGSRRYLEALSTYTRRKLTQTTRATVDEIEHVPAAIALHQRPGVPGVRSTFGTSTELLNHLRLMFSRLGNHRCPNGHLLTPTIDVALGKKLNCPVCGSIFDAPGADSFAFNSDGACVRCEGTGIVREIDDDTLVPNQALTINQGAVEPWKMFGISWMSKVAAEFGVRTDVPFSDLTENEKQIVYDGPEIKKIIMIPSKNGKLFELNATYRNARKAVKEALKKAETEKGLERINKYLSLQACPECLGTRLNEQARSTLLGGINISEATSMTLDELVIWIRSIPFLMPEPMRLMAENIVSQFLITAQRLLELGLGYLSLDRSTASLSTGERQRMQLARAVRNRTTGILYVLDEPSIGLHPSNIEGLLSVMRDLVVDGNSVVFVDHDIQVLREADYMLEMGPDAGEKGGYLIASGTIKEITSNPASRISGFLSGKERVLTDKRIDYDEMFVHGRIHLSTLPIHTVHALDVDIPCSRLVVVTGVSGSGKTTLVLDSLVPALTAQISNIPLPKHIKNIDNAKIRRVNLIDATPIGINVRSTVATYSNILDELRQIYAMTPDAKQLGYKAGDFSYNTGKLRCHTCDGTGQISLDMQFLPDVNIVCPDCNGSRYGFEAKKIAYKCNHTPINEKGITLPELMSLTVEEALVKFSTLKKIKDRLQILCELGLGYLTLGETTPTLSGGEAQRLKLASEMGKVQNETLFVFDEPTIGLHPADVRVLLNVFQHLVNNGATVLVIEHDLDMIANADYIIDMGPGGGNLGGYVVAAGTPEMIASNKQSITGKYLN